jgi:hypothetical protein
MKRFHAKGSFAAVDFSCKLDALHTMAINCAKKSHAMYLIQLLVEHAEEIEMTEEFLKWMKKGFGDSNGLFKCQRRL